MTKKSTKLQRKLEAELDGEVFFDSATRGMYSTDASVYQIVPSGVVIPRSREDVISAVQLCREHNVSITARGGGTSQAGQAVGAGIQLDFSKYMNRVLSIDPDGQSVTVEPGVVLDDLNTQLKPYGLQLPLDLSTSNRATIGGMIGNNSCGTRSVIYGKTIDYVKQLTVVMANGGLMETRQLGPVALNQRCARPDFDGECHRVVRDLVSKHAGEIEQRYPKILRRVGGYNLDVLAESGRPFNLSHLIVGSEGTLGLVVEAKLRLVPLPPQRVLCVVQFGDLLEALGATPLILSHEPSAVEVVDKLVLSATRGKPEYEPLRDFIIDDPEAILIVEFEGEELAHLESKLDRLEQDLRKKKLGYHFHRATERDAQARIWKLRKAALGLSISQIGDAKSVSFVEDTAVAPGRLRDYISRFQDILAAEGVEAGFYAHASVGLLHIRPIINMKTAEGVAGFERLATQVSSLVLEFGGALSGEHGDGLVRSPFQEKMFGPVLYQAFCDIKQTFDPRGLLNPGKIVHAPPLTENLRFGPGYQTPEVETTFDFSDVGGFARATEQCGGVGACRKTLAGTMCPSYMVTRHEGDSTRGRANALRLAISGQLGERGLSDPILRGAFDLCLECKSCKTECPTGVDVSRLKSEYLHQYHLQHGASRRERLLSRAERVAIRGSRWAPLSNWFLQNYLVRWCYEKLYGFDRRRTPPVFARQTFLAWWNERVPTDLDKGAESAQVALFADTFTNYYEPRHAMAAVQLAETLKTEVVIPPRVCCGRPLISKGFLAEAAEQAAATVQALTPLAERGVPIVFCEPSCFSAVKDDHPHLLRDDLQEQAKMISQQCMTVEEWIDAQLDGHEGTLFEPGPANVIVHGHCHQKTLVGMSAVERLLARIPGCAVDTLDSGCCGMAGSFGYEREHYSISQAVGERRLLPAVRARSDGTIVVAPGFSCRHQIKHFTGVEALSSPELLASLIKLDG